MLDLEEELDAVLSALDANRIEYAVCGGIAMAIHGYPRATVDIDLLVRAEDESPIYSAVEPLGFRVQARPMRFDGGAVEIRRVTKIDSDGETIMLDLLFVTTANREAWETRQVVSWRDRPITVVSPEGLIALKLHRSSQQDLADIERLHQDDE
jgi:Nucleotidyl transferase AbiEii toxin, Type IV TA system